MMCPPLLFLTVIRALLCNHSNTHTSAPQPKMFLHPRHCCRRPPCSQCLPLVSPALQHSSTVRIKTISKRGASVFKLTLKDHQTHSCFALKQQTVVSLHSTCLPQASQTVWQGHVFELRRRWQVREGERVQRSPVGDTGVVTDCSLGTVGWLLSPVVTGRHANTHITHFSGSLLSLPPSLHPSSSPTLLPNQGHRRPVKVASPGRPHTHVGNCCKGTKHTVQSQPSPTGGSSG